MQSSYPAKKTKYVLTPHKRRRSAPSKTGCAVTRASGASGASGVVTPNIRKTLANIRCTNVPNSDPQSYFEDAKKIILKKLKKENKIYGDIRVSLGNDLSAQMLKPGIQTVFPRCHISGDKVLVLYEDIGDTTLENLGYYRKGVQYYGHGIFDTIEKRIRNQSQVNTLKNGRKGPDITNLQEEDMFFSLYVKFFVYSHQF